MRITGRLVRTLAVSGIATMLLLLTMASTSISVKAELTPEWNMETDLPGPRAQATVIANESGMIFVMGGFSEYWSNAVNTTDWMYNPYDSTWTEIASMPYPSRGSAGVISSNGKIYVFGGRSGFSSTALQYTQIYDPSTDTWTTGTDIPIPVYEARAAIASDYVFLAGGADSTNTVTTHVQIYQISTGTWTTGTSLPEPRRGGSLLYESWTGSFYYFGGAVDALGEVKDTVLKYTWGMGWSAAGTMPAPSASQGGAVGPDGLLYLIGGKSIFFNMTADPRCYVYDPFNNVWSTLPDMEVAAEYCGVVSLPDGRIMTLGGTSEFYPLTQVESLKVMSIEVNAPEETGTGQSFEGTVDFEFAYASPIGYSLDTYFRSDAGVIYGITSTSAAADGKVSVPMTMPQSALPGGYELVLLSAYIDYDGGGAYSDYLVKDHFTVVAQPSIDEQLEYLQSQIDELKALNDALNSSLVQAEEDLESIQVSVDDKASGMLMYLTIGLLIVAIALMAVMLVFGRRKA
jgi:N-acetylneuraminic acid mutarotase